MTRGSHQETHSLADQVRYLVGLSKNTISVVGVLITTVSALLMMVLFAMEFLDYISNPYVGILTYLLLPLLFLSGLVLIPIGIVRVRKWRERLEAEGKEVPDVFYPCWDFNDIRIRRTALFFVLASVANVVILSTATYQGVHYMETVQFCGTVCHTVMQPEFTTYQGSPHSRVSCTGCHIGPGASWFVKSKLSGARQVFAVTFNTYQRPIPTPVHNLRPARETCEQCHWPQKFHDAKVRVIRRFSEDEANTQLTTTLLIKTGGSQPKSGNGSGIHWWHMDPVNRVTYIADERREKVFWVEHRDSQGVTTQYRLAEGAPSDEELAKYEKRLMDCVDCHNRPTHIYRLPEESVDEALAAGQIDAGLPFIKREGVVLLKVAYSSHKEAYQKIDAGLKAFYEKNYPEVYANHLPKIEAAAKTLGDIFARNVFPEMKVTWGTYPNNIGHQNFPGCFRCHDESHQSVDGKTISQDCSSCHDLLTMEEESPPLIPSLLTQNQP
ncbi:MAG: NapC/NirT family cytochrome c [Acidobacteriota bacterium]